MKSATNHELRLPAKDQLNVQAKIGTKIELGANYNTEATFDFENKMKLEYRGTEDEIIQLIEAGNVTLPFQGTLITGTQGLFGFKTQLRFGKPCNQRISHSKKQKHRPSRWPGVHKPHPSRSKPMHMKTTATTFLGQFFATVRRRPVDIAHHQART
jgi:hypothetical protein